MHDAVNRLLEHSEMATFGTWEEHLRKHFNDADRAVALISLGVLATKPEGSDMDVLLGAVHRSEVTREQLRSLLMRLDADGFIAVNDWVLDSPTFTFRNPLLRRWWNHYKPSSKS